MIRIILLAAIRIYQIFINPILGKNCRFYPSCSNYTKIAIIEHGTIIGIWLSIKRLSKCNPFFDGGYDPVPKKIRIKTK